MMPLALPVGQPHATTQSADERRKALALQKLNVGTHLSRTTGELQAHGSRNCVATATCLLGASRLRSHLSSGYGPIIEFRQDGLRNKLQQRVLPGQCWQSVWWDLTEEIERWRHGLNLRQTLFYAGQMDPKPRQRIYKPPSSGRRRPLVNFSSAYAVPKRLLPVESVTQLLQRRFRKTFTPDLR